MIVNLITNYFTTSSKERSQTSKNNEKYSLEMNVIQTNIRFETTLIISNEYSKIRYIHFSTSFKQYV